MRGWVRRGLRRHSEIRDERHQLQHRRHDAPAAGAPAAIQGARHRAG
jgi:hypothetical protein